MQLKLNRAGYLEIAAITRHNLLFIDRIRTA